MSAVVLDSLASRLRGWGHTLARFIRGGKPPPAKRWSFTFVLNLVSGVALVGVLFFNWFGSLYTIALNTQDIKCLPGTVFLLSHQLPQASELQRESMYWYFTQDEFQPFAPAGVPIGKMLAGLPGDRVEVTAQGISINGKKWGELSDTVLSSIGQTRASVSRSFVLAADEVLMLGTLPRSFDGRYLGPIKLDRIQGRSRRVF